MQVKNILITFKELYHQEFEEDEGSTLYIQFFDNYFVVSIRKDGVKTNHLYPMHGIAFVQYN